MADYKVIEAELRTQDFGSAGSRRCLRAGRIPAVVYGKSGVKHITISAKAFEFTLRVLALGMACTVVLDGQSIPCVFQDMQENISKGVVLHVDFKEAE